MFSLREAVLFRAICHPSHIRVTAVRCVVWTPGADVGPRPEGSAGRLIRGIHERVGAGAVQVREGAAGDALPELPGRGDGLAGVNSGSPATPRKLLQHGGSWEQLGSVGREHEEGSGEGGGAVSPVADGSPMSLCAASPPAAEGATDGGGASSIRAAPPKSVRLRLDYQSGYVPAAAAAKTAEAAAAVAAAEAEKAAQALTEVRGMLRTAQKELHALRTEVREQARRMKLALRDVKAAQWEDLEWLKEMQKHLVWEGNQLKYERKARREATNQRDEALEKLARAERELAEEQQKTAILRKEAGRLQGKEEAMREGRNKHYQKAMASKSATKEALGKEEKQRIRADAAEADAAAKAAAAASAAEQAQQLQLRLHQAEKAIQIAQQSSDERIAELEELYDFQEREAEAEIQKWKQAEKEARSKARQYKPPQPHAWESLTEGGERWARKVDIDFLMSILSEREWRASDVSTALHRVGLLGEVFDSCEVWTMRIAWMNQVLDRMEQEHWNSDLTASVAVAMNLYTRNLDEIRKLTGKAYNAEVDRYDSIIIAENPWPHHSSESVKLRSPIRPRSQWLPRLQVMRSTLRTEVAEYGQTASRSL
eukprot:6214828-Pleurochrysis_carterae.AAC.2